MKSYHFVKYNENTSLDSLLAQPGNQTTICFDLEDSIQDCLNPERNSAVKDCYRKYFKTILQNSATDIRKATIGVRISATNSPEHRRDLATLAEVGYVSTIFLPKVSKPDQFLLLLYELEIYQIGYSEIIPVIETKEGMNNLEKIMKVDPYKIRSVAFGHCDYNLDNNIYPFLHQDSREYWPWIAKMAEQLKPGNFCLVNSPFLQLENNEYFRKMLDILHTVAGENVAQITLTRKQTGICNSYVPEKDAVLPALTNKPDLRVPRSCPEDFIETFEGNIHDKGFVINSRRTLLSPQEYNSSLRYQRKADFPEINFTFVGGCFPVQGGIAFEDLFHQVLKRNMEKSRDVRFNVNIIRYERFSNCVARIASYKERNPIDVLVFSIRPEPFLRLVKLYYRFQDKTTGKKDWLLNLPAIGKGADSSDLLPPDSSFNPGGITGTSAVRKAFINLNYMLGSMTGNDNHALKKYLALVNEVIAFAEKENIRLIILGPPIRTITKTEKHLSHKLDRFMVKSLPIMPDNYISGADLFSNGAPLFNGIYANERYHEMIAGKLLKILVTSDL